MLPTEGKYAGAFLFVCLLTGAILGVRPDLDLAVSGLFYTPGQGFLLAVSPVLEGFRTAIWDLSIVVFLVTLLGVILALFRRRLGPVPSGVWIYLFTIYVLGPMLLVNGILKAHWGRARPAHVVEFGGQYQFTPFWWPSDQCLKNCSFVSGEVAAAFAVSLAVLILVGTAGRRLGGALRWACRAFALVLPLLVMAQRVAAGRHFLSDVIFAGLFVLLLAYVLKPLLKIGRRVTD